MTIILRFVRDDSGATAIEYALIASLIAIAVVGAAGALGTKLRGTLGRVAAGLS